MKTTRIYPDGDRPESCNPLAPIIQSGGFGVCNTCCPSSNGCAPRLRLKDYILVRPNINDMCFSFGVGVCPAPEMLIANQHCFTGKIRRRGECHYIDELRSTRATPDGAVCFDWPIWMWRHGDGRYEMDVLVDSTACGQGETITVGLNVRGAHHVLLDYMANADEGCSVIKPCAPQIEDEPYTDPQTCWSERC